MSRSAFTGLAALALALACFGGAAEAKAGCHIPTFSFYPETNRGETVPMVSTPGARCAHAFAEGPGYRFFGMKFDAKPAHGTIERTGPYRFSYRPDMGFSGRDFYAVTLCAVKGGERGCSTLRFEVTIE